MGHSTSSCVPLQRRRQAAVSGQQPAASSSASTGGRTDATAVDSAQLRLNLQNLLRPFMVVHTTAVSPASCPAWPFEDLQTCLSCTAAGWLALQLSPPRASPLSWICLDKARGFWFSSTDLLVKSAQAPRPYMQALLNTIGGDLTEWVCMQAGCSAR